MKGVRIDDVQSAEELRVDYSCLRGLLAIELKTLEEDGAERMGNLTGELSQRDDWPRFLGSAPITSFLKNTSDPEGLNRRVLNRIGRGALNHLKKANRQLEAHCARFPRQNVVRMLVLLNEDHEVYDPHTISYLLWHALRRVEDGRLLYEHIDLIIYITERHAQIVDNIISFPTIIVEGKGADDDAWKSDVGKLFVERWARWNGKPLVEGPFDPADFTVIDAIPDTAPRHEMWRIAYRRNPYMKRYATDQLRNKFDEIMAITVLGFVDGSPNKPPHDVIQRNMESFSHLMIEMGERAIPITAFPHDPDRAVAAAKRLGLSDTEANWVGHFG